MAGALALVRHAESTWNAEGRWQGQGDPPLSQRGRAQAQALVGELGRLGFELVVTSDLARAVETGDPLARALGVGSRRCAGLRELDLGSWTGLTRPEIAARDPEALSRFESGGECAQAGGAETRADLARRARASLAELRSRYPDLRIAVVTHLGVIRAILGEDLAHAGWRWLRKAP